MSKTNPIDPEAARLTEAAEAAVAALEALPEGEPFAQAVAEAEAAVEALASCASDAICPPRLERTHPDVLLDFDREIAAISRLSAAADLVALHARSYRELRALVRGARGLDAVRRAAEATAQVRDQPAAEVVRAELTAFRRGIASQLRGEPEFAPWAEILTERVPDLERRVAAARARLEAAAAAAAAQAKAEVEAAERVLAQARAERRQALAARLEQLPASRLFTVPAQPGEADQVTATTLRRRILAGLYDDAFLAHLEREVAAAEAVGA